MRAPLQISRVYSPKLVLGDVGSGKSLFLTKKGIARIMKHRRVFANFDLTDEFKEKYPEEAKYWTYVESLAVLFRDRLTQAKVKDFEPYQDLLLVDEAWETWRSRDSMSAMSILMVSLVFLHRKLGFELVVAVQLASSLDKYLRYLAQLWILAERHIDEDGALNFIYRAWRKTPVSDKLVYVGSSSIGVSEATELIQYFVSSRPTSSEYENTLAELNALLGGTMGESEASACEVAILELMSMNPEKRYSRYDLVREETLKDYKIQDIVKALKKGLDGGHILLGEVKDRLRTYYAPLR